PAPRPSAQVGHARRVRDARRGDTEEASEAGNPASTQPWSKLAVGSREALPAFARTTTTRNDDTAGRIEFRNLRVAISFHTAQTVAQPPGCSLPNRRHVPIGGNHARSHREGDRTRRTPVPCVAGAHRPPRVRRMVPGETRRSIRTRQGIARPHHVSGLRATRVARGRAGNASRTSVLVHLAP